MSFQLSSSNPSRPSIVLLISVWPDIFIKLAAVGEDRRWLYASEFEAKVNIGPFEIGPNLRAKSEGPFIKTYTEVIKAAQIGVTKAIEILRL